MGKTLRNVILGLAGAALVATSSFIIGVGIGKIQDKPQKVNATYASDITLKKPESKTEKKSLESYFLTGDETSSIITTSTQTLDKSQFSNQSTGKGGRIEPNNYSEKIFKAGVGNYVMPPIENGSRANNLVWKVLEFNSTKDREDFVNSIPGEIPYPLFTDNNILALIEPTLKDSENLSPAQKALYNSIISNYAKRTGTNVVLSGDFAEQEELAKTIGLPTNNNPEKNNSGLEVSDFSNFNSASGNGSAVNNNTTNESVNTTATDGLEKYLFQGNELRFLELSKENASYHLIEEGGSVILPLELFTKEFNSNPVKIRGRLGEGKIKEFFDKYKIEEFEWAAYNIPKREFFSREHNLTLFLYKFNGKEEAKKFVTEECSNGRVPMFIKGDRVTSIYSPTFDFVYHYGLFSHEQEIMYMDLVLDYRDRTGMELMLNDLDLKFLEDLKKKYSWELRTN